jgi:hypothetical protein
MQAMKEHDDSKPLAAIIQLDDLYWGGELIGRIEANNSWITIYLGKSVDSKELHSIKYSDRFILSLPISKGKRV